METQDKYTFTLDFQKDLLKYILTDRGGYKAIELIEEYYFTLLDHSIIAYTLKRYYKKQKRIPGETILGEELVQTFKNREFAESLTPEDEAGIMVLTKDLYKGVVRDGDAILLKAEKFAQYVELKHAVEQVDLKNFDQYDQFANKVQKAIRTRLSDKRDLGSFLVADIKHRQLKRQDDSPIIPTPSRQINQSTNAGGYIRGSIIVLLDKQKHFKTGALANIAIGYLKMKKVVLVVDLENGEDEYTLRVEQSISGADKKTILSGEKDKQVQKILRKYKRLGAELIIKRLPALVTKPRDIGNLIDEIYIQTGLRVNELFIDYLGKMASNSNKQEETERISDAYVEMGDLAIEKDLEHVWTAHHVVRTASIRLKTKYKAEDIAKCIDITRHVQAIWGLNRSEDEDNDGLLRMELVEQRDGKPNARAIFKVDYDTQRLKELTKEERHFYDDKYSVNFHEEEEPIKKPRAKQSDI